MNYRQFESEYRQERMVLSVAFVLLMVVIGSVYAVQHSAELFAHVAHAYEQPTEVFGSIVRGIAQR